MCWLLVVSCWLLVVVGCWVEILWLLVGRDSLKNKEQTTKSKQQRTKNKQQRTKNKQLITNLILYWQHEEGRDKSKSPRQFRYWQRSPGLLGVSP